MSYRDKVVATVTVGLNFTLLVLDVELMVCSDSSGEKSMNPLSHNEASSSIDLVDLDDFESNEEFFFGICFDLDRFNLMESFLANEALFDGINIDLD
mmetsp:Transcript_1146/g.2606  ORF Transcript_1146/g.2606 Transcript_1146/m.2606 type:complete len:97 (-) Transcript_1146:968-1258(-)